MDIEFIIESIWYMMPAYAATIIPVLVKNINFLGMPINEKLFGRNKTYRGFIFGVPAAILIAYLQGQLFVQYFVMRALSIVLYDRIDVLLLGFLLGFGALAGDLVKSFVKRRMGIKEGVSWFPYDSIDYSIGALAFSMIIFIPLLGHMITIIIASLLLHILFVWIAKKLHLR